MKKVLPIFLLIVTTGVVLSQYATTKGDNHNALSKKNGKPLEGLLHLMDPAHTPKRKTYNQRDCAIPFVYETENALYIFYDCTKTLNPQGREWCSLKSRILKSNITYNGDWGFCM